MPRNDVGATASTDSAAVHARRFAKATLNLYEREGTFTITVNSNDLDSTVAAFLQLGCTALIDRRNASITVNCRPSPRTFVL